MKNTLFSFMGKKSPASKQPARTEREPAGSASKGRKKLRKQKEEESESLGHDGKSSEALFEMKKGDQPKTDIKKEATMVDQMLKRKKGGKQPSPPKEDARNKILSGKGKLKRKKQQEEIRYDLEIESQPVSGPKQVIMPDLTKKPVSLTKDPQKGKKKTTRSSSQSSDISQSIQKRRKSPKRKKSLKAKITPSKEQPLGGQTIVLSGINSYITKDKLKDLLLSLGAKVTDSVSGRTTTLLVGRVLEDGKQPHQGNKYKKATQKGVKIVHEDQLDQFFFAHCHKNLQQLLDVDKFIAEAPKPDKYDKYKMNIEADDQKRIVEQPTTLRDQYEAIFDQLVQRKKKQPKKMESDNNLWTDKYAPKQLKDILGNQGQIEKLRKWLLSWEDVHFKGIKHDQEKVFSKMPAGSLNSKACLISGEPGIGKTTAVRLIAQQLGIAIVEYNASDVRSKKKIESLQLNSFKLSKGVVSKSVILMDEVDGMSSGDRGGIKSIIQQIKKARCPIVCVCNDRGHQKIRSLAGHCLDLRFKKTNKNQIATRLQVICVKEGLKTDINSLQYLCQTMNNDIRQVITFLQFYSKSNNSLQYMQLKDRLKSQSKDITGSLSHFDAALKLLNRPQFSSMNLPARQNLFFVDSQFVPLLIHQNLYTSMPRKQTTVEDLRSLANATQAIAQSDFINRAIRSNQEWALMPGYAFLSTVYPTQKLAMRIPFPKFPEWLGKFSSQRKTARLFCELRQASAGTLMTTTKAMNLDISGALLQNATHMAKDGHIDRLCQFLHYYGITSNLFKQNLLEVQYNPMKKELFAVPAQIKRKLTTSMKAHEQAEIQKRRGKGKPVNERTKFDPLLEQLQNLNFEEAEEAESSANLSEKGKSVPRGKGKGKTKRK